MYCIHGYNSVQSSSCSTLFTLQFTTAVYCFTFIDFILLLVLYSEKLVINARLSCMCVILAFNT